LLGDDHILLIDLVEAGQTGFSPAERLHYPDAADVFGDERVDAGDQDSALLLALRVMRRKKSVNATDAGSTAASTSDRRQ
jgi:hypothetical protein